MLKVGTAMTTKAVAIAVMLNALQKPLCRSGVGDHDDCYMMHVRI